MNRLLIVGKVVPGAEPQLAQIFADADETELPTLTGARHRSLYRIGDLFLHLLELESTSPAAIEAANKHPVFVKVSERLSTYVSPYLSSWRSPRDALAGCFYRWDAPTSAPNRGGPPRPR